MSFTGCQPDAVAGRRTAHRCKPLSEFSRATRPRAAHPHRSQRWKRFVGNGGCAAGRGLCACCGTARSHDARGPIGSYCVLIAQSFDSLSSGKVLPRDNGPIHKQWLDLIRRHDCIATDKAISRVLLLYKRCRDKTSMIVDATLGHQDDLWAVTLIQLGDTNAIAQKALLMAAASPCVHPGQSIVSTRLLLIASPPQQRICRVYQSALALLGRGVVPSSGQQGDAYHPEGARVWVGADSSGCPGEAYQLQVRTLPMIGSPSAVLHSGAPAGGLPWHSRGVGQ